MAQPQTAFADQKAWLAHLEKLGFTTLDVTPDPPRAATEAALWGSVRLHRFLCDGVVLGDDAGQFNVGRHALCWVDAERLVHKLDPFTDRNRAAQAKVRGLIWDFYTDLKACRLKSRPRRAAALGMPFARFFLTRTGFVTLDRPQTPLHTNGSERDIRCYVTRRKLSAGTRSDAGRDCGNALLGLAKTCAKLGIEVYNYLSCRQMMAGSVVVQPLDVYLRGRFCPA
jgi:hypothetical protein